MNLNELVEIVLTSQPEDWRRTGGPPPSRHEAMAVLDTNPSVSMAWGQTLEDPYDMPWAMRFPDRRAASFWVDIYFNGVAVFREALAAVDGSRCYLPVPLGEDLTVAPDYVRFASLVTAIDLAMGKFSDYFHCAGLVCADSSWPRVE